MSEPPRRVLAMGPVPGPPALENGSLPGLHGGGFGPSGVQASAEGHECSPPARPHPAVTLGRARPAERPHPTSDGRATETGPVQVDVEEQMLRGGHGLLDVAAQQHRGQCRLRSAHASRKRTSSTTSAARRTAALTKQQNRGSAPGRRPAIPAIRQRPPHGVTRSVSQSFSSPPALFLRRLRLRQCRRRPVLSFRRCIGLRRGTRPPRGGCPARSRNRPRRPQRAGHRARR